MLRMIKQTNKEIRAYTCGNKPEQRHIKQKINKETKAENDELGVSRLEYACACIGHM